MIVFTMFTVFIKYFFKIFKILFNLIKAYYLLLLIIFTTADILIPNEDLGIKIFIALIFSTAVLLSWFLPKRFKKTRIVLDVLIAIFLLQPYV